MKTRILLTFLSLGLLFTTWGCAHDWYKQPEKFKVQPSRLNWVSIYYQASAKTPRIRCEMSDNGQKITILEGHSVTVGDDFNIGYQKSTFSDVKKYYYSMPPEMFQMTLQTLIDVGLMEREEPDEDTPLYPKVMIKANINHKRMDKFTFKQELIDEIRTLLFQYKMSGSLSN